MIRTTFALICLVGTATATGQNIVTNGSFATDDSSWGGGGTHNNSQGCDTGSGPGSLALNRSSGVTQAEQCINISLPTGENLLVSACINPTNYAADAGDLRMALQYFTDPGCAGGLLGTAIASLPAAAQNTWTNVAEGTGTFGGNVPINASSVRFTFDAFSPPNSAVTWIDDVSIDPSLPVELESFSID